MQAASSSEAIHNFGFDDDGDDSCAERARVVRVAHKVGGLAHHFGDGSKGSGDDGRAAGEGLEWREAETLVSRWKDETRRAAIEGGLFLFGDGADEANAFGDAEAPGVTGQVVVKTVAGRGKFSGDDKRILLANRTIAPRPRGEDVADVFVRLKSAEVEHVGVGEIVLLQNGGVPDGSRRGFVFGADGEVHGGYFVGREAEVLDDVVP